MIKTTRTRGFTLVELLIVVAILAVMAAAAAPLLSSGDQHKLNAAAGETANLLRFALSEARRTGGYVLVDGKSTPGQLKLWRSNVNAQVPPVGGTALLGDPVSKQDAILDVAELPVSRGVALSAQFRAGGSPWPQLLIGPGLSQLRGFDGASANKGALQANSAVLLSYGGSSVSVGIDAVTGRVILP